MGVREDLSLPHISQTYTHTHILLTHTQTYRYKGTQTHGKRKLIGPECEADGFEYVYRAEGTDGFRKDSTATGPGRQKSDEVDFLSMCTEESTLACCGVPWMVGTVRVTLMEVCGLPSPTSQRSQRHNDDLDYNNELHPGNPLSQNVADGEQIIDSA